MGAKPGDRVVIPCSAVGYRYIDQAVRRLTTKADHNGTRRGPIPTDAP